MLLAFGDHLGSSSVIIDRDTSELVERVTYHPFGATESDYRSARWQAFRDARRFTGKEEDPESGLQYFGARYYSPFLGRFISADPLTIHGAAGDLNPYAYVSGRVFNAIDPFGLDGECIGAEMKGACAGALPDGSGAGFSWSFGGDSTGRRGGSGGNPPHQPWYHHEPVPQFLAKTVPFSTVVPNAYLEDPSLPAGTLRDLLVATWNKAIREMPVIVPYSPNDWVKQVAMDNLMFIDPDPSGSTEQADWVYFGAAMVAGGPIEALEVATEETFVRVAGRALGADAADGAAGVGLLPGEGAVGTYDDLIAAGAKGDNVTPHHIPSRLHMEQHGVARGDGIAINMEHPFPGAGGRHRATFTYGTSADVAMSPRSALAAGVRDVRRIYQSQGLYTPEIRSGLRQLIQQNKAAFPGLF